MTSTITTQHVHWDLDYDIHLGETWGRFMNGLAEKKIYANTGGSSKVYVPPMAFCEESFEPNDKWIELSGEGVLEVFTVAWQGFRGGPATPYAIGAIRLDGADTLLMHYVVGLDFTDPAGVHDQLPKGSRVRAVWAAERSGQILDISHFEPVV
ncbi:OB-fold domain-containing protein [Rhodococcus sp. (in: high G+C Gram-positive bacteria)]|uniref:Zn-ribbon domain-containing OB-fold protein n=1 Tax=Rhodococcus sp. TaxID=1831 RepID=UPI00257D1C31|nr:OB-fold domain-containing protein [Rhodococcus sp. (in: high G+C Gram-positive bacteria)]MBQ7805747.1 OB-fold domain-containing protein [Rhodococcus sp. (in: high G+C Gram-positive bacteria)]